MQSYWGIDHGDVISKSRKSRGAVEGGVGGGVTGAAIGAGSTYGARRMLVANSVMQQRGYVPEYETLARAKKIIPNKTIGKVGAAGLGVGAATGAAVGAYKNRKISKKAPAERWYGTRDSSYNSRKENVKGGAAGGALGAGGVAGAVGAYSGRSVGRYEAGNAGRHLTNAARAKNVTSGGRLGALKGAALLGGLGAAGGAAYGSALGAVLPHKNSRGSAARRRFSDTRYQNKQAYKKQNKAAESRYYRDLSKS